MTRLILKLPLPVVACYAANDFECVNPRFLTPFGVAETGRRDGRKTPEALALQGGVYGEVGAYGTDANERGVLVICSDGTLLEVKYGKGGTGIWGITLLKKGDLFDRIEICEDEDATSCSDQAFFKPGLKSAYAAKEWESVS